MRISSRIALIAVLSIGLASSALAAGPSTAPRTPNEPGGPLVCTGHCPIPVESPDYSCSDTMRALPRITAGDIENIADQRVHLAPLCDFNAHSLTDVKPTEVARGNVTGLRDSIESNPVLMAELAEHGYRSIDVVGILLGSNAAVLYVHKV